MRRQKRTKGVSPTCLKKSGIGRKRPNKTPVETPDHEIIEELQVAEEELRHQNEELAITQEIVISERQRYQALFDFAPDGYLVTDLAGIIREANHSACLMLNASRKSLVGKPLLLFIIKEDRRSFNKQIECARKSRKIHAWETHIEPRQNAPFPVEITVSTERDPEGGAAALRLLIRDITERKRVEKEIEHLASFPQLDPNPIIEVDSRGKITFFNPAAAGVLKKLGAGKDVRVFLPDDVDEILGALKEGNEAKALSREVEIKGRLFAESIYLSRSLNVIRFYARDITERRQAAEALRQTRDYLENLFGYANAPVIVWDPAFKVTRFNHAFERLTGYKAREVIGKNLQMLFPKATREESLDKITRTLKGEYWESVEIPILRKDGKVRLALWNSANIHAADGKTVSATIAQGQDITERKRAEEALRETLDELEMRVQERTRELRETNATLRAEIANRMRAEEAVKAERQQFNDVVETLPAYVILLTPDYHVPFANRFFRERFGESGGRRCFEYLFQRTEPCENCETYKVLKTMAPREWEWTGPDGRDYYIYDFPFVDTDGSTLILEMGIDITDQKQAHEALRRLNETLEQRVAERTAELAESEARYRHLSESLGETVKKQVAELRQAQTLAALGQMISVVAHEIKNPLQNVNFGVDALKALEQDEKKLGILNEIRYGASLMNSIVAELLQYAKAIKLECAPWPIRDLVAQALGFQSHKLENISVTLDIDEQRTVFVDAEKMIRVLTNLISNAADAMPYGGDLRIYSECVEDGGQSVVKLCVSDTGCGISEEHLERVQEPFFTTKTKGIGLGLAICKKIIETHDGGLSIRSKVNEGTTVEITLPLDVA